MITKNVDAFAQPGTLTNPFPGLRPFEYDESHLFFGRDGQSEQLITKLARSRFLAVVGASGSGKSSLVRAGLLPALDGGFMTSAGANWRVAILRPGNDPIGNLAQALNAPAVFGSDDEQNRALQTAITEATLQRGSRGLIEAVRQAAMPGDENLLVVVDQFEELFRFAKVAEGEQYHNEAAAFVKLLLEAPRQTQVNVYVTLTMRSDFLGDCAQFWGLPEAINESQYLIPRLTRDQLREAITGPAAVGGGVMTPRLESRLLNDVGDNPDQLPILQHALMRMWDEWQDRQLAVDGKAHKEVHAGEEMDLCCYEAIGGLTEALSRHAEEAYAEVGRATGARGQQIVERMFKRLTEKGADNREVRRPATLGEICAVVEAAEPEVVAVIETFRAPGRSFLAPPAGVKLNAESLIDISHESLIRNWTRLNRWVDEEARSSREYLRLVDTATRYRQGRESLLRDNGLENALDWRAKQEPTTAWARRYHADFDLAMSFLDESQKAREAEIERVEQERIEKEERRRRELRRTRMFAAVLAGALLLSLVTAAFAWHQQQIAVRLKDDAETQKQKAETATQDALMQKGIAERKTTEAEDSARKAEEQTKNAEQQKQAAEIARRLAEELRLIAVKNGEDLMKHRHLFYTAAMKLAGNAFEKAEPARGFEFLNSFLPTADGTSSNLRDFYWYYLWKNNYKEKAALRGHADSVRSVAFSPDGKTLASASSDNTVKLWDVAGKQELATLIGHASSIWSVAFAPDGRTLASASDDKTIRLYVAAKNEEVARSRSR